MRHLYVARGAHGHKIGVSGFAPSRMRGLKAGTELVRAWERPDAYNIERAIKIRLRPWLSHQTEWFTVAEATMCAVVADEIAKADKLLTRGRKLWKAIRSTGGRDRRRVSRNRKRLLPTTQIAVLRRSMTRRRVLASAADDAPDDRLPVEGLKLPWHAPVVAERKRPWRAPKVGEHKRRPLLTVDWSQMPTYEGTTP